MEKRPQPRWLKRLFVKFGEGEPTFIGYTTDVSETGLFIKATTIFPPKTFLKILLTLPDERVIELTGDVVWSKRVPPQLARMVRKNGMGIQLREPPTEYVVMVQTGRLP